MFRYKKYKKEWVSDKPLPRKPFYKKGDIIKLHGQDVKITSVKAVHSVSGPIGCLLERDKALPDEYFHFLGYHLYHKRKLNGYLWVFDTAYHQDMKDTSGRFNRFDYPLLFDDEIPKPKKEKKIKIKKDPNWEYKGEKFEEAQHHQIWIQKPKFNVTRKEFHSMSYYGIASFIINYPISFEEFKAGIKIYMPESTLNYFQDNWRFEGMEKLVYKQVEFGFIKVPREHPLFQKIKNKLGHYFLQ